MLRNFLIILTILVTFFRCTKNNDIVIPPNVITQEVSNITDKGALFSATVDNVSQGEALEYGFVWSSTAQAPTISDETVILNPTVEPFYSIEITTRLESQVEYYVRAYIKTEEFIIYGNIVSFLSLGSSAPTITSIIPTDVYYGDTLSISGTNFSTVNGNNLIKTGGIRPPAVFTSDSLLKVVVQDSLAVSEFNVSVSVAGNIAESAQTISFKAPQINSLSKNEVVYGDTVELYGRYFGYRKELNTVKVNGLEVEPIETDSTKIRLVLPVTEKTFSISVTNSVNQTATSNELTTLDPVLVSLTPDEGFYGDQVEIQGENFGHIKEIIEVYFNDKKAIVVESSNESAVLVVPSNIENPVSMKMVVQEYEAGEVPFEFTDLEVSSFSPLEATWRDEVTITGINFSPKLEENSVAIDGYEAEIVSSTPTEIIVKIPDEVDSKNASIQVKRLNRSKNFVSDLIMKDPVFTSISMNEFELEDILTIQGNNFHPVESKNQSSINGKGLEIITVSSTEITLKSSISIVSNELISEKISGQIEIKNSIGSDFTDNVELVYTGPWTQLNSTGLTVKPGMSSSASASKIYTAYQDIMFYDPTSDSWTTETSIPAEERTWSLFFNSGDDIVIGSGVGPVSGNLSDMLKYSTSSGLWESLQTPPFNGANGVKGTAGRHKPYHTVFNDKQLLINTHNFYEYLPQTDNWSKVADVSFPFTYQVLIGTFLFNDKLHVCLYQVNNLNVSKSTLHFYEWNESTTVFDLKNSVSPFGANFPSFVALNNEIYLVENTQIYKLTSDLGLQSLPTPFSSTRAYFAESLNGKIYVGYNDGSFWSFDPSK